MAFHEELTCTVCFKQFINKDVRRAGRKTCSAGCYNTVRAQSWKTERKCDACGNAFVPTYECQKYCKDECKRAGISKNRKRTKEAITCLTCKKEFVPTKKGKQYCTHDCFAKRFGDVTKNCEICSAQFTVAYRFREQKTCGSDCNKQQISKTLTTRELIECLRCHETFDVVKSYKEDAKYCSQECFLATRKTRQPDVVKTCESCKEQFTVFFTDAAQRFCDKSCANSGEFNSFFGVTGGAHPCSQVPKWHAGKTKHDDPRLRALGEKISIVIADKMVNGTWKHGFGFKGEHFTGIKNGGIEVYLRSSYESTYARMLDADPDVLSWEHEPMRLPYLFEGSMHNYVPDFMVTRTDGTKQLIEVKPENLSDTPTNLAKAIAASSWCDLNNVQYVIVTEKSLDTYES